MTIRYTAPNAEQIQRLMAEHSPAISIYLVTSPVVSEREHAEIGFKSAMDDVIDRLREAGATFNELSSWKRIRAELLSATFWSDLSNSLAIFLAPGIEEVFVLPSRLDNEIQVGERFAFGQLFRALVQDQEAYAVTVSTNEWDLWHATATSRATPLGTSDDSPRAAEDAANRDPSETLPARGGRQGDRGMSEKDRRGSTRDIYAKRVASSVDEELSLWDHEEKIPLFVFAAEPMLSTFLNRAATMRRPVLSALGAADRLTETEIDETIRVRLSELNIAATESVLRSLTEGSPGRKEDDIAAISRSAANGLVDTFWFDFTVAVNGNVDIQTGAIEFSDGHGAGAKMADGSSAEDILPQIAVMVLTMGGRSIPVRGTDLDSALWTGPAVASLRFPSN